MNQEQPKPWWKSSEIRLAISLFAPLVVQLLKASPWKVFGIDFRVLFGSTNSEQLVDFAIGILAASAGVWWVIKRIAHGKRKPPSIAIPGPVQASVETVQRLTR
jgi:hypothetical protein